MRHIKVVPLEATGIYLVDACGVPIVKAKRARRASEPLAREGLVVRELPATGARARRAPTEVCRSC